MAKYKKAPEVKRIASELIDKYHSNLLETKIIYLFRDNPLKIRNKIELGKASKVSGKYNAITGADFLIEIWEKQFFVLDYEKQVALVDHQLSHCFIDIEGKRVILGHDFEGFNSELERYGFWTSDLEIMEKRLLQMKLPFKADKQPYLRVVSNQN